MSTDDAVFSDFRMVQHNGADTDKRIIANFAAMQHGLVPDSHAFADLQLNAVISMQDRQVLDVGILADNNPVGIPANNTAIPDAGIAVQHDIGGVLRSAGIVAGSVLRRRKPRFARRPEPTPAAPVSTGAEGVVQT